ncbi:MAG: SMC-Scp complex subunit ScpB [Gammaproteobacteria bacterium]
MENQQIKYIVEAALLAAGRPVDVNELQGLFGEDDPPGKDDIRAAIADLQSDYAERGIAVQEVASGFRVQVRASMSNWLARLWEERAPRYSRALMETLAIIAYRQPVTRGDVEDIRGVGVTTNIMRSLLERNWIRVVGFRDVPGKPAIYGTTKEFLDYFDLKKLDDLPPLADLKDLEAFTAQLELSDAESLPAGAGAPLPALIDDDLQEAEAGLATVTPISEARSYVENPGDIDVDGSTGESGSNVVPLKVR